MTEQLRVFVYGTLKPGEENFHYCQGRVQWQAAIAPGRLYDLPMGYPAMTPGEGWVQGYVFTLCDPTLLAVLDQLEGYDPQRPVAQNEYLREWIDVFSPEGDALGRAWTYRMTAIQARSLGGVLLPNGCWTGRATSRVSNPGENP